MGDTWCRSWQLCGRPILAVVDPIDGRSSITCHNDGQAPMRLAIDGLWFLGSKGRCLGRGVCRLDGSRKKDYTLQSSVS